MPDLLLELFSEEIPARMQRQAAGDLKKLVTDALVERGLVYEGAQAFATPRRLTLTIFGPVSYTHLDVYKRQPPPCSATRKRRPRMSSPARSRKIAAGCRIAGSTRA